MKTRYFIVAAAVVLMAAACDKSEFTFNEGKISSRSIMIGKAGVSSPVEVKSGDAEPSVVGEVSDINASFTVTETVTPMGGEYRTKAETTTSTLRDFTVWGYLDKEILQKPGAADADKANLNFIPGATAVYDEYSDGKWKGGFTEDYKWRFGTHHHFWATPNSSSLNRFSIDQNDFDEASFSYTSNGTEDVILAYSKQYFGKDEEAASTKDSTLHLTFNHALAAVKINAGGLVFKKRKTGESDEPAGYFPTGSSTPRCEVTKYEVRGINDKGDCVTDGTNFTWSNLSLSNSSVPVNLLANNESQFIIPQERYKEVSGKATTVLHLEVIDRQRELTRPFVYETSTVFGTGLWQQGHGYQYTFTGSIIVPKLPEGQTGIDAGFTGKPFQYLSVIDNVSAKYIKKIRLTWTGLPGGNSGNGTFAFISYEPVGSNPAESSYMGSGNEPVTSNSHIGFIYNYKTNVCLKGTVSGTSCSCDITLPDNFASDINIYAAYIGSNSSGTCNWFLHNLKFEIIEWK